MRILYRNYCSKKFVPSGSIHSLVKLTQLSVISIQNNLYYSFALSTHIHSTFLLPQFHPSFCFFIEIHQTQFEQKASSLVITLNAHFSSIKLAVSQVKSVLFTRKFSPSTIFQQKGFLSDLKSHLLLFSMRLFLLCETRNLCYYTLSATAHNSGTVEVLLHTREHTSHLTVSMSDR